MLFPTDWSSNILETLIASTPRLEHARYGLGVVQIHVILRPLEDAIDSLQQQRCERPTSYRLSNEKERHTNFSSQNEPSCQVQGSLHRRLTVDTVLVLVLTALDVWEGAGSSTSVRIRSLPFPVFFDPSLSFPAFFQSLNFRRQALLPPS